MTTIANLLPNGDTKRILDQWIRVAAVRLSKLREAGLIATNDDLNARAAGAGHITSIPFYNALDGESEVANDDLSDHITAGNLSGDEILAVRQLRAKSWAGAQLASLMSGLDVMAAVANGVGEWRALDEQKVFMAMLAGIKADAVANSDAAMLAGSATAKIDGAMLADACQTKGERKDALNTLIVHSAVHAKLVKDNQIAYIPASEQNTAFQSYQGKRLVVSDAMPSATVSNATSYTSVLCGPGIFSYGEATPARGAVAVVPSETAGNGWGGDQLIVRRQYIAGVQGYSFTGTGNPDNTALASASNYVRKVDPALIPLVFITSDLND